MRRLEEQIAVASLAVEGLAAQGKSDCWRSMRVERIFPISLKTYEHAHRSAQRLSSRGMISARAGYRYGTTSQPWDL